jgi:hypothetical protein
MAKKHIMMEIIFYYKEWCRKTPPELNNGKYCPHLLVKGHKKYLGVKFIDGEEVVLGKTIKGIAECLYENVNYKELEPNATFFIMEGGNKVGEGKVI